MDLKTIRKIGTCFGLGDVKNAPGTIGTLGGIPIFFVLTLIGKCFKNEMMYNSIYFIFLISFFGFAVYVSNICEKEIFHQKDAQNIVIDEVLGFLTTLFLINPRTIGEFIVAVILGFGIFRLLDITKPGIINKSQNLENGVGVVMDDFLAGVLGNLILVIIWNLIF